MRSCKKDCINYPCWFSSETLMMNRGVERVNPDMMSWWWKGFGSRAVSLTHHGLVDVVLQRVDEQIPHRLPGDLSLLCPGQPQVELVHGALQVLESLQGSLHLTLPATHVSLQTLPSLPHLARLLADGPGQPSSLLLWGEVWRKRREKTG